MISATECTTTTTTETSCGRSRQLQPSLSLQPPCGLQRTLSCIHVVAELMVQIPAMTKRGNGRAPLSVVVAIIGGLALAGIIFTDDLRSLTGTCFYCCGF